MKSLRDRILTELKQGKRKTIDKQALSKTLRVSRSEKVEFLEILDQLAKESLICRVKGEYALCSRLGLFQGVITRVNQTFGFIRVDGEEKDLFVVGKLLKGAMPEDIVLIKKVMSPKKPGVLEAEVLKIIKPSEKSIVGVVTKVDNKQYFMADRHVFTPLTIVNKFDAKTGEKVLVNIVYRGQRHSEHKVEIIKTFGSAENASSACDAILAENLVPTVFSRDALEQAKNMKTDEIDYHELDYRLDLREDQIFTIDGSDTKDIDDAISIEKHTNGWYLGVHIADVSHYVKYNTPIDREAYNRATSVYYADKVVPMLPKQLSNGICSLNPEVDRLAFSALISLNNKGDIIGYDFKKTVIRSRIQGVYSEINSILDGSADGDINIKYQHVEKSLFLMQELAGILQVNHRNRGGFDLESKESKIIIDSDRRVVDITPRTRGVSEHIIEEFMLIANECAAKFGVDKILPFLYRVHPKPSGSKLETLHAAITSIGLNGSFIDENMHPKDLAGILAEVRGTNLESIVNNQVLRSMSKAIYSHENTGHYGLVLENYSHFTSPIRRYPDLIIHRIMGEMVSKTKREKIRMKYMNYVPTASKHCTDCEIRAMVVERSCEDCYKAEFMRQFIGQDFDGVIGSVTGFGIYVDLPNTVEGLLHINNLPDGEYIYDGTVSILEKNSNTRYRVGDSIRVKVLAVDVSVGQIDFGLCVE